MEGKIEFVASPGGLDVSCEMNKVSRADILVLFDAMVRCLELEKDERELVGNVILAGGLCNMPGVTVVKAKTPKGLAEFIRKMKEKKANE